MHIIGMAGKVAVMLFSLCLLGCSGTAKKVVNAVYTPIAITVDAEADIVIDTEVSYNTEVCITHEHLIFMLPASQTLCPIAFTDMNGNSVYCTYVELEIVGLKASGIVGSLSNNICSQYFPELSFMSGEYSNDNTVVCEGSQ